MAKIEGSCHCKNIQYVLHWPEFPALIPVRECGCSFCQKHGGAWTSNRGASLDVTITDSSTVSTYQFGTATAAFHVCGRCGVVAFVTSDIEDQRYAVVNTNTFDDKSDLTFSRSAADFEGEDLTSRLARRKKNWIADVRITEDGAAA